MEAADLARRLDTDPRIQVTTSLAGRTRRPAAIAGPVRVGGFGGAEGLAAYLVDSATDAVIDATHPFAATISANAAEACAHSELPHLMLVRPPWVARPNDRWTEVDDAAAAADAVARLARRAFLTTGRQDLDAFSRLRDTWFLVRLVEAPEVDLPLTAHVLITARGPFALEDERALFEEHAIDLLVSKNAGGSATYAKIEAARDAGLPVVMIRRPHPPTGELVSTVDEVLAWLDAWAA